MTDPDQVPTLPAPDPAIEPPPVPSTDAVLEAAPATEPTRMGEAAAADPTATTIEDGSALQPIPGAGVRYAVLRLLLLVTVGGLLALLGMRGWALLFVAVLVSGILSFFIFVRQREAAARNLEAAAAARAARHQPHPQGEGPAA